MSIAFIILIIVLVFWPWISRFISRMVSRFMANRAEDMMRRMMGMPSRKEERRRRKSHDSSAGGAERYHRAPRQSAGTMLRSVAEDAEYTEVVEFDMADIGSKAPTSPVCEEQVSDVEYTEYKE